jgi:hypothetical protein
VDNNPGSKDEPIHQQNIQQHPTSSKKKKTIILLTIILLTAILAVLLIFIRPFSGSRTNTEQIEIPASEKDQTSQDTDLPLNPNAKLLLKSGFEQGVFLANPIEKRIKSVPDWRVNIEGSDNSDAQFNWSSLPGELYYAIPASENLKDYAENKIEKVSGPNGPTNALFMGVKDYYKNKSVLGGLTRNQYVIYPDENFTQAYARYWIKFQPDLKKIMPKGKGAWRIVMEWFENGNDYRWNLALLVDSNGELYWKVNGERNQGQGWNIEDWRIDNHNVPVPVGEWFLLETFFKHSSSDDGRVWFAVNGKTIADYKGRNKINGKIETWLPLKVYTGENELDRGPAYQWVDNIEIYDSIPAHRLGNLSF